MPPEDHVVTFQDAQVGSAFSLAKTHIENAIITTRSGQADKSLSGREAALVITKLEEASLWLTQASAKA